MQLPDRIISFSFVFVPRNVCATCFAVVPFLVGAQSPAPSGATLHHVQYKEIGDFGGRYTNGGGENAYGTFGDGVVGIPSLGNHGSSSRLKGRFAMDSVIVPDQYTLGVLDRNGFVSSGTLSIPNMVEIPDVEMAPDLWRLQNTAIDYEDPLAVEEYRGLILQKVGDVLQIDNFADEMMNNYNFELDRPLNIPLPEFPEGPPGAMAHCGDAEDLAIMVCHGNGAGSIPPPGLGPGDVERNLVNLPSYGYQSGVSKGFGSHASHTNRFSFATTVGLQYQGDKIACTGTLISSTKILTAAHCSCRDRPIKVFFGESLFTDRWVQPGIRTSLDVTDEVVFYDAELCEAYAREGAKALRTRIDLAVHTLTEALPADLAIAVLPVGRIVGLTARMPQSAKVYAVGFGESDNRWYPGDKNFTELDYKSRLCSLDDQYAYGCTAGHESIASRPPADTCFADSGGGLFVQSERGGEMILAGVTSRSLTDSQYCGDGGIYTSLESPAVASWVGQFLD